LGGKIDALDKTMNAKIVGSISTMNATLDSSVKTMNASLESAVATMNASIANMKVWNVGIGVAIFSGLAAIRFVGH
jgi:hypothetical protein